jgi:hypothetical protein
MDQIAFHHPRASIGRFLFLALFIAGQGALASHFHNDQFFSGKTRFSSVPSNGSSQNADESHCSMCNLVAQSHSSHLTVQASISIPIRIISLAESSFSSVRFSPTFRSTARAPPSL